MHIHIHTLSSIQLIYIRIQCCCCCCSQTCIRLDTAISRSRNLYRDQALSSVSSPQSCWYKKQKKFRGNKTFVSNQYRYISIDIHTRIYRYAYTRKYTQIVLVVLVIKSAQLLRGLFRSLQGIHDAIATSKYNCETRI